MNWVLRHFSSENERQKEIISQNLNLHPLVAQLLVQRGLQEEGVIQKFLFGTLADLPDPFLLPDMNLAVDRLLLAAKEKQKILLFGDYDVDGITGTAQIMSYLREIGVPSQALLPHRMNDGYGLTESSVRKINAIKPDLLVTIDNGTRSKNEIQFLKERGIEVIVIDHHETPSRNERPPVVALVNPKSENSRFAEPDVASAGLAFLVLMALRSKSRSLGLAPLPNLKRYLDLACLGTIADVVPLTGVNRLLVRYGLEELADPKRPGLRALCANASVSPPVTASSVAFRLAPRINAAGRLADPKIALDLLLAQNEAEASALAATLEALNRERQSLEEAVVQEAIAQVEAEQKDKMGIVVAKRGWHLGVVGIVAAKLTERFGRPSVVLSISEDGKEAKGSARTVPGFSVFEPLKRMEDEMLRFGGHTAAAGMTVATGNLQRFSEKFHQEVSSLWRENFQQDLMIDAVLNFKQINLPLVRGLQMLEPYGAGNPEPVFVTEKVRLESCRTVGKGSKGHLKTVIGDGAVRLEGIGFHHGDYLKTALENPSHRIAYAPQFNEWNGVQSIQLNIKKIQPHT